MVLTNGGWTQRTARGEPRATHPPTLICLQQMGQLGTTACCSAYGRCRPRFTRLPSSRVLSDLTIPNLYFDSYSRRSLPGFARTCFLEVGTVHRVVGWGPVMAGHDRQRRIGETRRTSRPSPGGGSAARAPGAARAKGYSNPKSERACFHRVAASLRRYLLLVGRTTAYQKTTSHDKSAVSVIALSLSLSIAPSAANPPPSPFATNKGL